MRRENIGLLAMTSVLICVFSSVLIGVSSWAALDIFDHPKEVEKRQKAVRKTAEMNFLDYPRECVLISKYQEALEGCQKSLNCPQAQGVKGDILYLAGVSSLKLNHFLEARSYFNDVLLTRAINEDLKADAYIGIADSYYLEGRPDKAGEAYNQLLTNYPNNPICVMAYYKLSEISYRAGRLEEARYYLTKVQTEFPFSFEARLARPSHNSEDNEPYVVQIGCFNEKDNADRLCEKLIREGFDAYLLESKEPDKPRFRVVVGRLRSKEEAEALEGKLKKAGYSTKIQP